MTNTNIKNDAVIVYPNPVENHQLNLSIASQNISHYKLSLVNESGMVVVHREINNYLPGELYQLTIPDGITKGFYILKVESNDFLKSVNIVIK